MLRARVGLTAVFVAMLATGALAHGPSHRVAQTAVPAGLEPGRTFDYVPPAPGSYSLPPFGAAADEEVVGEQGEPVRLADLFGGHLTVLTFIYTRCGDVCPLASQQMVELRELIADAPELTRYVRLISLSFDPEHDTPSVMREYGDLWRQGAPEAPPWNFLTTRSRQALATILEGYHQPVSDAGAADPSAEINHLLRVFLIDGHGSIRNIYSLDVLDPRLILADLQTLVMEQGAVE